MLATPTSWCKISWCFQLMTIYINQYQSISINQLILIMDDQSIAKICVVIDWYWLVFQSSISTDWKCRGKWVIQVHEQWCIFFAMRRLGRNCVNPRTVFVWLLIDHRLTDTNQYQSIPINSFYRLIGLPIIDFHRLETTRRYTSSLLLFFADIINPEVIILCWHY